MIMIRNDYHNMNHSNNNNNNNNNDNSNNDNNSNNNNNDNNNNNNNDDNNINNNIDNYNGILFYFLIQVTAHLADVSSKAFSFLSSTVQVLGEQVSKVRLK